MVEYDQLVFQRSITIFSMFSQAAYSLKGQSTERNSSDCSETEEALYLEMVQKEVGKILVSLHIDRKDCEQKSKLKYQQLQLKIEKMSIILDQAKQMNNTLKNENDSLRLTLQQMGRNLRRSQLKQETMLKQIESLKIKVVEKEAIIKYLEEKTSIITFLNSQNVTANKSTTTINLNGFPQTSTQKDISFSRSKEKKNVYYGGFDFEGPLNNLDILPKKSATHRKNAQARQKSKNNEVAKDKKDQITENENSRVDSEIWCQLQMNQIKKKQSNIKKLSRKNSVEMVNSLLNCSTNFKPKNAKKTGKTAIQQGVSLCRDEVKNSSSISRCRTQN